MPIDRYHRQTLLPQIGIDGQAKLRASKVLLVGMGALGCGSAMLLARAGVGELRLLDRDIVELTNLQRQILYTESDVAQGLPKAVAAAEHLCEINSQITLMPLPVDLNPKTIDQTAARVDLIVDGTDNVAARMLINDWCVKNNLPWIYAACVGTAGRVMPIWPNVGPCLRCVFEQLPEQRELETCDTAGVLNTAATIVASIATTLALQLLIGEAPTPSLISADVWNHRYSTVNIGESKRPDCPTCGLRRFEFLSQTTHEPAKLCGRDAVQIQTAGWNEGGLKAAAERLKSAGSIDLNPYFLRCRLLDNDLTMTVFGDGRVIVQGTSDLGRAKSIVGRYL